ncbi:uncharacterized protein LOC135488464 [Lineus longissimus]|uniref:uncharacterized protein LOC135488464 n=1 Tax=Lineus longissimus TaxID=88925 RepID=UPI00315D28FA
MASAALVRSDSVKLSLISACKLPNLSGEVDYTDGETLPRDVAVMHDDAIAVIDPWCRRISVFEKLSEPIKHYKLMYNFGGQGHAEKFEVSCPIGIEAQQNAVLVADADMVSLIVFGRAGSPLDQIRFNQPPQCISKRGGKIYVGFTDVIKCYKMHQDDAKMSMEEINGTNFNIIPTYIDANENSDVAITDGNRIYLFCNFDSMPYMTPTFCEWSNVQGLCFVSNDKLLVANHEENTVSLIHLTDTAPRELDIKHKITILSEDDGIINPRAVNVDNSGDVIITQWDGSIKLFEKEIIPLN